MEKGRLQDQMEIPKQQLFALFGQKHAATRNG